MIKRLFLPLIIFVFCIVIGPGKIQSYNESCIPKTVYPKFTGGSAYIMYWCEDNSLFCNLQTKTCVKADSNGDKSNLCSGGAVSFNTELKRDVCIMTRLSEDKSALTEYPNGNKLKFADGNLGGIISEIIKIVYWLAGLSMMAMIIIGGLGVMTSVGIPEKTKMGYGKISGGLIGFLIIFSSYLIIKLVETMFGIKIF